MKQEPGESEQPQQQAQLLEPVKRMSVKSRSIFTPIDESRSILSQHWASSTSNGEPARTDTAAMINRSQSVDVGAISRTTNASSPPPTRSQTQNQNTRNPSMSSVPEGFHPPSRTNSASIGGKRPALSLQIPDEVSEGGSATANSDSPRSGANADKQRRTVQHEHSSSGSGVVLPPPSPSASALLSAGASGPPNPFARPHPVSQQQSQASNTTNNMIDTPVSALPSRFMTNEFLPSPSSFFNGDWNFRENGNTMPSPLNFATPVVGSGPSFLRDDIVERANGKRKTPDQEGDRSGEEGGGKRVKQGSP